MSNHRRKGPGPKQGPGPFTLAVHGYPGTTSGPGVAPTLDASAVFSFESMEATREAFSGKSGAPIYARFGNPTVDATEQHLATLDHAERSVLFSSGMAAIALTTLAHCGRDGHAVVAAELYGGTVELFQTLQRNHGLDISWVSTTDAAGIATAVRETTRMVFLESPTNPLLRVLDVDTLFKGLGGRRPVTVLDGTFATPLGQSGLDHGFDLVVHSATKYLGGHDDLTAGVLSGGAAFTEPVRGYRKLFGATAEPQTAWLLRRGLKTLAVRWERQCRNAHALAKHLEAHDAVNRVYYPGLDSHPDHELAARTMRSFGAVVAFEVKGGDAQAARVYDALQLILRAPSLGGVESMILHPVTTSHRGLPSDERERLGITGGLLRLSVGIEDPEDLWDDLAGALSAD